VGASHQTGWSALVTRMIDELAAKKKLAATQAAKAK
jgi:hypothetical protein